MCLLQLDGPSTKCEPLKKLKIKKQLWTWERLPSHRGKQAKLDSIWDGELDYDSTSCSWVRSPVISDPADHNS